MIRFRSMLLVLLGAGLVLSVRPARAQQLLVSGFTSDSVVLYDGSTGALVRVFDEIRGPQSMVFGPDGNFYLVEENRHRIVHYDGVTGAFLGPFIRDEPGTPEDESGGLRGPTAIVFGPDGNAYVASFITDSVLRYDGTTGDFIDEFVPSGSGGLDGPDVGMIFGPDGNLYVPSFFGDRIPRYDGITGAFLGNFVTFQSGGLRRPRTLIFHTDDLLYVTGEISARVHRYDGTTGVFVDAFVSAGDGGLAQPTGMEFGPDGHLYVSDVTLDRVLKFDGTTGDPLGDFTARRAGGLIDPTYLRFVPTFRLRIEGPTPGQAGTSNEVEVTGATPGDHVLFGFGTQPGSIPLPNCPGIEVGMADPRRGGRVLVDEDGMARLVRTIPARLAGTTILVQAVELGTCRVSEVVEVVLE